MSKKIYGVNHFNNRGTVIDNVYENYSYESCYTCIHCTENKYCSRTGLPIPEQGKNMYRNCSRYKSTYKSKKVEESATKKTHSNIKMKDYVDSKLKESLACFNVGKEIQELNVLINNAFKFTDFVYGNIFFLCIENKKSFKNIIYQAGVETFMFQKKCSNI